MVLITQTEFREEFAMSSNIPNDRINASIIEAQDFDVKPVLGSAFFYLVNSNYNTSPVPVIYSLLVEGGTYLDCNGDTVAFAGLAKALKYYALARFRKKQIVNDTNFGVVIKRDNYSDSLDFKTLMTTVDDARATGGGYIQEVLTFLNANLADYPLFKNGESNIRKPIRVSAVSRKASF